MQGLSVERPLAILSDNSVEHAPSALAAQHVGVLVSLDLAGLVARCQKDSTSSGAWSALLEPGAIYVSGTKPFAAALAAIEPLHQAQRS